MAKYYGVWIGRNPGVYESWDDCKAQVDKYPNAKFSKLNATTKEEALIEFNGNAKPSEKLAHALSPGVPLKTSKPTNKILTVDGAANGISCEYQAVWTTGEKVFASKVYQGGTNNIAEFLGLVSAIQYLHENNLPLVIYTDSVTAIAWVRNKSANTTARNTGKATEELDELITKAEQYLITHSEVVKEAQILKWETKQWGEIPADYGRK